MKFEQLYAGISRFCFLFCSFRNSSPGGSRYQGTLSKDYRMSWSNGKNNKLLFTQNVDDENGYIIPEEFTAKKITFAVSSEKLSGSEEDPVIEYVYDCTTEQITKVEK